MTLSELLSHLDAHTGLGLLDGSPQETLDKARDGEHTGPIAGEIVKALGGDGERDAQTLIERAQAVKALGPLRLKYMGDDAPVEGFRMVEKTITGIDEAFNEEALKEKG
ncbi:hypothetical protein LRB11_03115 [Ectothiorhodospira haloalkaliphila]|uniref:hypothetical protein n=2 Tax=Ectothiorhodospira TaxID=1051 RepID=UPI001EE8537C|nr:hypothetical protein [Ectothiorhodospira haloalkaliphila]MCG5523922.1 hypothetical protein [Ectothiorhodospira haloalkaliphila]